MKKSLKRSRQIESNFTSLCTSVRLDDGIPPPAILAKIEKQMRDQRNRVGNTRSLQLCEQIKRALADALVCDCNDSTLADASVEQVEALSGSSVLLATVSFPSDETISLNEWYARLQAASGQLRAIAGRHRRSHPPQTRPSVALQSDASRDRELANKKMRAAGTQTPAARPFFL
jgi:ribosome-binding factor A